MKFKSVLSETMLSLGLGAALTACGGGGGGATTQPPVTGASNVSMNVVGVAPSILSGTVSASDPQGLTLSYSLARVPTVGGVTLDPGTGKYTYIVTGVTLETSDSFVVAVSNGQLSSNSTVSVALHGDPLLGSQWHLKNVGAPAFSSISPTAGNDLNVTPAWSAGYTGQGVKVAVLDSGLEIAHEDLADNVDIVNSHNFLDGSNDPTRASADVGFDHGTSVAGIIAAVAFNGKGGRGVAYHARLRGYNLLAPNVSLTYANYADALGGQGFSADNDIFNASFTTIQGGGTMLPPRDSTLAGTNGGLSTLRGGKGALLVNAAGNDFGAWESGDGAVPAACAQANALNVSCGDPAHDARLGGETPIIVGALNANGVKSSYSSTGSSLWISAPGGEFGFDAGYESSASTTDQEPAIVTTNRNGCANTVGGTTLLNGLDSGGRNVLARDCQYTAVMNGTSAATPNTSATIALMLEANPALGSRDVKFILAKTAKVVDPLFAGVTSTGVLTGQSVVLDQGWVRNGAGFYHSNYYGFGAVDAGAAVAMARTYAAYLPALQAVDSKFTHATDIIVPSLSVAGKTLLFSVSPAFTTVEQAIVVLNISSSPGLVCNQLELVSPSGTKSIILHAGTGYYTNGSFQRSITNGRLLSNAFYGEPAAGTWRLTILDFCPSGTTHTVVAPTDTQTLSLVGH